MNKYIVECNKFCTTVPAENKVQAILLFIDVYKDFMNGVPFNTISVYQLLED